MLRQPNLNWLSTSAGVSTAGTFGILQSLRRILLHYPIKRMAFVFDAGISKRRIKVDPTYKESRRERKDLAMSIINGTAPKNVRMDKDLTEYIQLLKDGETSRVQLRKLLPALGIPIIELKGREADDVIGVMAIDPDLAGDSSLIISEDKDMLQLVKEDTHVYRPIADRYINPDSFEELVGFKQRDYMMARAVMGDTSDGIPGVMGTGEKTIRTILEKLEDPSELLAHCAAAKTKRVNNIAKEWDRVQINLQLMDVRMERFALQELQHIEASLAYCGAIDDESVVDQLETLEAKSMLRQFNEWALPFHTCLGK
ncbi:MAG: hypothetical protein A2Y38_17325 [Spirochaetes bacterium GWB1_59_5]|nr:MAG: hypothetical protein A2Y38_17325 [Spirochaetes bacterium GWB1_59_5]